jgi:hypothetical protein
MEWANYLPKEERKMKIKQGLVAMVLAAAVALGGCDKHDPKSEIIKLPQECEKVVQAPYYFFVGLGMSCQDIHGNYRVYNMSGSGSEWQLYKIIEGKE